MSASEGKPNVFSRMAAWCRGLVETVSPDLARCEFECRARECSTERFDACENRKDYASKISAKAQPETNAPDGDVQAAH